MANLPIELVIASLMVIGGLIISAVTFAAGMAVFALGLERESLRG
jgi:hypothetical protein